MLDTNYLFLNEIVNDTYKINDIEINILFKKNITKNLMEINNKFYASSLNKTIKKYFYCFPKTVKFKLHL